MNYKKFFIGLGIVIVIIIVTSLGVQNLSAPSLSFPARGLMEGKAGMPNTAAVSGEMAADKLLISNEKKVVKTASLQMVVQNASWSASTIRDIAEKRDGFVESLNITDNGDAGKKGYVTIRVPVAKFSETLEVIKSVARVVEVESIQARDVTQEFIDLSARLKNLQASEAQYLEIMKKAQKIEDILRVQERLSQVRGEIESLQGQIKYLNNQTDLATISVALSEEPSLRIPLKDFRPSLVIQAAAQSLLKALVVLFNLLVQVIFVGLPLLFAALIIAWLLWKIVMILINHKWF